MRSPCTATKSSPCSLQLERAGVQQRRPNTTKNRWINKFIKKKEYLLLWQSDCTFSSFKNWLNSSEEPSKIATLPSPEEFPSPQSSHGSGGGPQADTCHLALLIASHMSFPRDTKLPSFSMERGLNHTRREALGHRLTQFCVPNAW